MEESWVSLFSCPPVTAWGGLGALLAQQDHRSPIYLFPFFMGN